VGRARDDEREERTRVQRAGAEHENHRAAESERVDSRRSQVGRGLHTVRTPALPYPVRDDACHTEQTISSDKTALVC
jgi:hypothetical protein